MNGTPTAKDQIRVLCGGVKGVGFLLPKLVFVVCQKEIVPRKEKSGYDMKKYHRIPVSAPTRKEPASCHLQPITTTKMLNKLKISDFLGPIRELSFQEKLPL